MRRSILLAQLVAGALASSALVALAEEDTQPPVIRHTVLTKAVLGRDVTVAAGIDDDSSIFAAMVWYRFPGTASYTSISMEQKRGMWLAVIPGTASFEYWIEAYDEQGNGPTRDGSPDEPHKVVLIDPTMATSDQLNPVISVPPRGAPAVAAALPPPPVVRDVPAPSAPVTARITPEPPPEPPRTPPPARTPPKVAHVEPEDLPPPVVDVPLPASLVAPPVVAGPVKKPFYKEWWFLGTVGGVAAGALIGGIAYAMQPQPVDRVVFGATLVRP